jgi:hypothetical protein
LGRRPSIASNLAAIDACDDALGPIAPPTARSTVALFVAVWALLAFGGRARLLHDPGTFWHTLTGDRIFAHGFPRTDWLTFTFAGRQWIAHQWLGECMMSVLHRLGGLDALLIAASAALAFLLAWLFGRLLTHGLAPLYAVAVVALAAAASSLHFHVRPHLLSIFAFAWMFARLADVERGRKPLSSLWPTPIVFLAWINAHGAAVGGLATLAVVEGGWTVAWMAHRPSPIRGFRDVGALAAIAVACLAMVPLTPYGLDTARAWFSILSSPALPRVIVEHGSVVRTHAWQVLALAVLYAAALTGASRRAWTVTGLVPLLWLVLTFDRVRQAPFFAVSATIALESLLPRARWVDALANRGFHVGGREARPPGSRLALAAAALVLVALAAVSANHRLRPDQSPVVARLDPDYWPVGLVPALRAAERELPRGSPILNDMLFGGFIEYETPGLRVFVDDRWELFGDRFMLDYVEADRSRLDAWVVRAGVELAIAAKGSGLDRYLQGTGWQRVATSLPASLYRRYRAPPR